MKPVWRVVTFVFTLLFIYLLLFIVFKNGVQIVHKMFPDVLGYATDIHVEQLLEATNQKRQSQSDT